MSARAARQFVRAKLVEHASADAWVDTAELLVSELVTNALVHARTGIGLAVVVFVDAIRLEVSDGSYDHPAPRTAGDSYDGARSADCRPACG